MIHCVEELVYPLVELEALGVRPIELTCVARHAEQGPQLARRVPPDGGVDVPGADRKCVIDAAGSRTKGINKASTSSASRYKTPMASSTTSWMRFWPGAFVGRA